MVLEPEQGGRRAALVHRPGRFLASWELMLAGSVPRGVALAWMCGRSGGGNGLFSMCIAQSLTTSAQCEWIKEEPSVSPTAFCSFAALSATSVLCRVLCTVPGCDTAGCQGLWGGAGVADPVGGGSALPAGTEVIFWEGELQSAFPSLESYKKCLIQQQRDKVWQESAYGLG